MQTVIKLGYRWVQMGIVDSCLSIRTKLPLSNLRPNSWTKSRQVLRVLLLAIHSHLHSFALRFIFLQTHATSYDFQSSVTLYCKGHRRKTCQKPYPLSFGLRNPYRTLKSENSQDYAQKPQRNCTSMNSASGFASLHFY